MPANCGRTYASEIDGGAGGAHAEDRKITSELLVHLTADDRTAIVVGATNRPDDIDPAILRPGRLASHIEIGLPGEESRQAIFEAKLRDVPHDLSGDELALLARHSAGISGAEIEEVINNAKRHAARRDARVVSLKDFPSIDELETLAEAGDSGQIPETRPGSKKPFERLSEDHSDDDSVVGYQ
jgi:ATP-dependent Zn protease